MFPLKLICSFLSGTRCLLERRCRKSTRCCLCWPTTGRGGASLWMANWSMKTPTWPPRACEQSVSSKRWCSVRIFKKRCFQSFFPFQCQRRRAEGGSGDHGLVQSHGEAHRWRVSLSSSCVWNVASFLLVSWKVFCISEDEIKSRQMMSGQSQCCSHRLFALIFFDSLWCSLLLKSSNFLHLTLINLGQPVTWVS